MTSDQVQIVLIAAAWATAAGAVGLVLSWVTRRRSFHWLLALVALVCISAVIAGVIGTARAMFLSSHDFGVVVVVCFVAGVVALGFAWVAASTVVRSSRSLQEDARRFGVDGLFTSTAVGPAELQAVSEELARTSKRLQESRDREQRLESSRRELISWVSHDLRTPLAALTAMTEALEDGLADDPTRYYHQMQSEANRMVRMVDDLFELSQIHAGVLQLTLQPVALRDVVSEVLAGADPVARSAQVRLAGTVDETAVVRADPARLSRVVGNLLMNAIRHTPADGVVSVHSRHITEGDRIGVELTVSDSCGGIPDHELSRVFDLAWRGNHARTPVQPNVGTGAGLGLAIVKGIVDAHQGHVAVRNHPPGCQFLVTLPSAT
jgi:signal transduction histidine kinase